jgi:hypothetical protein
MYELASGVQTRHVGENAENGRVVAGSRQGNGMVHVNLPLARQENGMERELERHGIVNRP